MCDDYHSIALKYFRDKFQWDNQKLGCWICHKNFFKFDPEHHFFFFLRKTKKWGGTNNTTFSETLFKGFHTRII